MKNAAANVRALLNVLELGAWDVPTAKEAVGVLESMGRAAVPTLTEALTVRRGGALVRAISAWLLGRIGGRRALAALCAAQDDEDGEVARTAARALEGFGSETPAPCAGAVAA